MEPKDRPLNALEKREYKKVKPLMSKEEFVHYFSSTCVDYKENVKARMVHKLRETGQLLGLLQPLSQQRKQSSVPF